MTSLQTHPSTPSQEYVLASWGKRFAAILIDIIAFNVLTNLILAPLSLILFGSLIASDFSAKSTLPSILLSLGVTIPIFLVYYSYMIARTNGQTFGKKILGIRIVREDATPMTFGYATFREGVLKGLGGMVLLIVVFIGWIVLILNYFWPLKDHENRTFHDMIAKTRVIESS